MVGIIPCFLGPVNVVHHYPALLFFNVLAEFSKLHLKYNWVSLRSANGTFLRHLKCVRYRRGDIRAAVKHSFFSAWAGLGRNRLEHIFFIIPASNLLFRGLFSKTISFSYNITHYTDYMMLVLWNTCTNLFLPKPAQSEKTNVRLQQGNRTLSDT